jgi:hypothetical protein
MDMMEVECMNILEEHERPSNQRPVEEGMDMAGVSIWWRWRV